MNIKEIEILLDRYYDGDTTLAEEKILKDFFSGDEVPDHLKDHQPFFSYLRSENEITSDAAGQFVIPGDLEMSEHNRPLTIPMWRSVNRRYLYSGIAAAVLLLVAMVFTFRFDILPRNGDQSMALSEQQSMVNAAEALMLVSSTLNKGLVEAGKMQYIDKAMHNVELLSKFYQYQPISLTPDNAQTVSNKNR